MIKKSYLAALAITTGATLWMLSGQIAPADRPATGPVAAPAPQAPAALPAVRVRESLATAMTAHINVTGRTEAMRRVELRSEIAAPVQDIVLRKGAAVKAGTVMARLAENDRRVRLAEARARVRQREIEFKAAEQLAQKGFNSQVRLAQTRADLDAARAEVRRAEIDLANVEIKAPFDGIIADQAVEIGDYVAVGAMTFTIVELDPLKLVAYITEKQIANVRAGMAVDGRLLNGEMVSGTVSYIAPAADPATRTFRIEATIPNPDSRLAEGMTATLHIPVTAASAHRISPSSLTLDDTGRVGVKLVDADNRVVFMPVLIVSDEPDHMWVAGLPAQIRLISIGQDYVRAGQEVQPVPAGQDGLL